MEIYLVYEMSYTNRFLKIIKELQKLTKPIDNVLKIIKLISHSYSLR